MKFIKRIIHFFKPRTICEIWWRLQGMECCLTIATNICTYIPGTLEDWEVACLEHRRFGGWGGPVYQLSHIQKINSDVYSVWGWIDKEATAENQAREARVGRRVFY